MTGESKPIPPPRGVENTGAEMEPCYECGGVDAHADGCVFVWAAASWYGDSEE